MAGNQKGDRAEMKQKMKKDRKQSGQLLAQIKGGVHWKGAAAISGPSFISFSDSGL